MLNYSLRSAPATSRRNKQRGVELLEFTLVLLPLLGFTFLLLDLGWAVYTRATLQFAVREGCRYAVTNQTQPLTDSSGKAYGVVNSIKYVVQRRAIGLLGADSNAAGWNQIQVNYYAPTSLTSALPVPTNCTNNTSPPNQGGNVVEVSIVNYKAFPFAPVYRTGDPLIFTARSSDLMEGNPPTGVPLTFDGTCP
jgi:Flp pilus assembly protein TadG